MNFKCGIAGLDEVLEPEFVRLVPETSAIAPDEWTNVSMKVPHELSPFMHSDNGAEWIIKMKTKTGLFSIRIDKDTLILTGDKEKVNSAFRLMDFSIQHLSEIENVKRRKKDMNENYSKLTQKFQAAFKVEFEVPMEIVGLLVGAGYKNIREMEKKHNV